MQIERPTVQSVTYTTLHHDNRITTTRREYSEQGGYQRVSEIEYVTYTNQGRIDQPTKGQQLDLYV